MRAAMFAGNVRFEDFCDAVSELFGSGVCTQDIKRVFQKISTKPNATYDWFEVHYTTLNGWSLEEVQR